MISEEKINVAVRDAVAQIVKQNLGENLEVTEPPHNEAELAPEPEKPIEIPFDELDSLRVSNYILRVQNERVLTEVEERRRKHTALELSLADKNLHEKTADRHGIDLNTQTLQIDFEAKMFRVEHK